MITIRFKPKTILICVFIFGVIMFVLSRSQLEERTESQSSSLERMLEEKEKESLIEFRQQRYKRYMETEKDREGPGELGREIKLQGEDKQIGNKQFAKEGFSEIASDLISLDRSLHDARSQECRNITYPKDLPKASVVLNYYNEYFSAILRTAHSIVNRTPPEYLEEVILLDDGSTKSSILAPLDAHVAETWPDGIVRVVRCAQQGGLIRARLEGAKAARGDVLIVMDAHCEVTKGWIEPLLARIKEKRSAVLVPTITKISATNMAFTYRTPISVGGFSWDLFFSWKKMSEAETKRRKSKADFIRSPTMPGGLFAVDRKYFFEIGGYDDKMQVWGGENLEMSFRIWTCGGSLEFIPCSIIGHIFRDKHTFSSENGTADYNGYNTMRMARVWMDDYIRHFLKLHPYYENFDYGDISERVALRKRLNCKPFKWFLDNVYPDKFVPDENAYAYGQIKCPSKGKCLDVLTGKIVGSMNKVGMYNCHEVAAYPQLISYTKKLELRIDDKCIDILPEKDNRVVFFPCHGSGGRQSWLYNKKTGELINSSSQLCLDASDPKEMYVAAKPCSGSIDQRWEILGIVEPLPDS